MIFANRAVAGRSVAKKLETLKGKEGLLVLGMARGGVAVAFEVAAALHAPLDVFVVRKLGIPGHEEMAFGAIASGGVRVLDQETIRSSGISALEVELISATQIQELERREREYRGHRAAIKIQGRTVILVDDGMATGESMEAAIQAVREQKPATLTAAVPIAPALTCRQLAGKVDNMIAVYAPASFRAVSEFYEDFSDVTEETVKELLRRAAQERALGSPRPK